MAEYEDIELDIDLDEPQELEEIEEIEEEEKENAVVRILKFMEMDNIADVIDEQKLAKIGQKAKEDYETDYESLDEWRGQNEDAIKLARQVREDKTFPWTGASNVKFPLVSQAAMNFNARAYPEIVQGDKVVKAVVIGNDDAVEMPQATTPEEQAVQQQAAAEQETKAQDKADRAERISTHMSYQLTQEIPNWETDVDKMLIQLPIVGTMFKEVTWDDLNQRPAINLLMPDELTINYEAKSIDLTKCRRISKEFILFKNDIVERERAGLWSEIDYTKESLEGDSEPIEEDEQVFIQQIRYLDLDEDGYEEPYIVTFLKDSGEVVRIVANYDQASIRFDIDTNEITKIYPYQIYTDYHFIPSFDGSFYSIGFGSYLYPINMAINTTINQLIDAGTLANRQGGFLGKGLRIRGGANTWKPGEWKIADSKGSDIAQNIVPLPVKEPSQVLFSLMQALISIGKDMSSITDVLSGVPHGQNTPVGTTMAMIEQGMKVMDAIYKRIYRSSKAEYKMLYRLNSIYLQDDMYQNILDERAMVSDDYDLTDFDIVPVGDTRISSEVTRIMKAQSVREMAAMTPGADVRVATLRLFEAMGIPNPEEILPQGPGSEELQQMVQFLQGQVQTFQEHIESGKMQMAADENARENNESAAKVDKDRASAIKYLSDAEANEIGAQLGVYAQQLQWISKVHESQNKMLELEKERIMQNQNAPQQPAQQPPVGGTNLVQ